MYISLNSSFESQNNNESKYIGYSITNLPENCHLDVKKLPLAILLKKMTIFGNFVEKNDNFWQINKFEKNVKFLAIF